MTNLFFSPISSEDIDSNFVKTVSRSIIISHLSNTAKLKKYGYTSRIYSFWGIKNIKVGSYNKSKINDYVCFYKKGKIIGFSKIIGKLKDKELSNELWGFYVHPFRDHPEYWENILVLDIFWKTSIDFNLFRKMAGYHEKYYVRSYIPINERGHFNIIKKYGSIKNMLNTYKLPK